MTEDKVVGAVFGCIIVAFLIYAGLVQANPILRIILEIVFGVIIAGAFIVTACVMTGYYFIKKAK